MQNGSKAEQVSSDSVMMSDQKEKDIKIRATHDDEELSTQEEHSGIWPELIDIRHYWCG